MNTETDLVLKFINDLNFVWEELSDLINIIKSHRSLQIMTRSDIHSILHAQQTWMRKQCKNFFKKYANIFPIYYSKYQMDTVSSLQFRLPKYHIFFRFPYDFLNILTETTFQLPRNPLISIKDLTKNRSYESVILNLLWILNSQKKTLTNVDTRILQVYANYRSLMKDVSKNFDTMYPPTKQDIIDMANINAWTYGNYIRYYYESGILQPVIFINPLINNKLYMIIREKENSQTFNIPSIMKFQSKNYNINIITSKQLNSIPNKLLDSSCQLRMINIHQNVNEYYYQQKKIDSPEAYSETLCSVNMIPGSFKLSPEQMNIITVFKFVSESPMILHKKTVYSPYKEVTKKIPVKLSLVTKTIKQSYKTGLIHYFPKINFLESEKLRLVFVNIDHVPLSRIDSLIDLFKQFNTSIHFIGSKYCLFFIKTSALLNSLLKVSLENKFPYLKEKIQYDEFNYPEPDISLMHLQIAD